jgi:F0F1-type ATP synthase membrane subunit b/b'
MNSRIAKCALGIAVLLWPSAGLTAEAKPTEGSWLALIFYGINFLLFLWVLRVYGWPWISEFFHSRSGIIRENRNRAERAFREAQELANRAAQLLRQLDADKQALLTELEDETNYEIRRINQAAREAVDRIWLDTHTTRAALLDGAQRRLRQALAEATGRIARELVSRNFQPSDQARLLQEFVERIGGEARQ